MKCQDCERTLKKNEEYMLYHSVDLVKCKKCHQKDPILRNFRPCEIYSRVVGYIRPVQQWHKGKIQEFKDRLNFKKK